MRFLSWLVGLALLALLALFCVNRNAPRIEAELTADAQAALTTAGLDPALVSLDGRDACLPTIPDADLAARARQVVESVNGIRVVDTGCGEIAMSRPFFRAERAADEIIIEGSMIPGEASRVYSVVNALAPSVPVVRRIDTDGVADEAWTDALPDAIRLMAARVLDPALTVEDGVVTVSALGATVPRLQDRGPPGSAAPGDRNRTATRSGSVRRQPRRGIRVRQRCTYRRGSRDR